MVEKVIIQDSTKVGTVASGVFTPVYEVNNGRVDLPDRAGHPALPLFNNAVTIADDAVLDIDFGGSVFIGWAVFQGSLFGTPGGMIGFRAGGTSPAPFAEKGFEFNAFTITDNTVLTGTTGADGAVTVSTTDGHLFIENRSGGSRIWHVTVFGKAY
jgi:hypothetical protein